jgi:spore germination protein GerM
MTYRRAGITAGVTALTAILAWMLFVGLPGWAVRRATPASRPAAGAPAEPGRKIKARLFYVSEDGRKLASVEQEVAFGEDTVQQAREIINAQIAPVLEPLVSAVPAGTRLRALFVTARGEAFVDFSAELAAAHPGGSMNELLTVYTIVHALTVNLPAVSSVQLLVEGREVDTLAGHVDLRGPITNNLAWVQ